MFLQTGKVSFVLELWSSMIMVIFLYEALPMDYNMCGELSDLVHRTMLFAPLVNAMRHWSYYGNRRWPAPQAYFGWHILYIICSLLEQLIIIRSTFTIFVADATASCLPKEWNSFIAGISQLAIVSIINNWYFKVTHIVAEMTKPVEAPVRPVRNLRFLSPRGGQHDVVVGVQV